MTARASLSKRSEGGAIAIIVAISLVMFMGLAALVVDLGHARDVRRQAQNAADASALAAGNELYLVRVTPRISQAVAAAQAYALANYGVSVAEWDSCTDPDKLAYVPMGSTPCISFDQQAKPLEVRVRIPGDEVQTVFGAALGFGDVVVAARAKARLAPGTTSICGLCVIGHEDHDLQNGDATVSGGDIHFNGDVSVSNNGLVATDGDITVEGSASGPLVNYDPDPQVGAPAIEDPLAGLPLPPDMSGLMPRANPCTDGPGIYGARNLRGITCNLAPGLYVISGPASGSGTIWDMAGSSDTHLNGTGVTLYFTCGTPTVPAPCAPGEEGATLDSSGNGTLGITGPTSGPLKGLAIAFDRNNASTVRLTGNGSAGMTGTIYLASGKLQMNGNGCTTTYNSLIVVDDLEMNGNPSCLVSSYSENQNVELPPQGLHLNQ